MPMESRRHCLKCGHGSTVGCKFIPGGFKTNTLPACRNLLLRMNRTLHTFDFAFQGISALWEGPQNDDFGRSSERALTKDNTRSSSVLRGDRYDLSSKHERLASARSSKRSLSRSVSRAAQYMHAVNTLLNHLPHDKREWKPVTDTVDLSLRRLMNAFNCWDVDEEQLIRFVFLAKSSTVLTFTRWEKAGMNSRAACWMLFTDQHNKALECLMRSKSE